MDYLIKTVFGYYSVDNLYVDNPMDATGFEESFAIEIAKVIIGSVVKAEVAKHNYMLEKHGNNRCPNILGM